MKKINHLSKFKQKGMVILTFYIIVLDMHKIAILNTIKSYPNLENEK